MRLSNFLLEQRLQSLEPALGCKGKLGFAAAKHYRKINAELTEYFEHKNSLIMELGEQDDDGNWFVSAESGNIPRFMEKLNEIGEIVCSVDVCTVTVADILDKLTGKEMAGISWMVSDWDDAS